ncbi:MAG: helix-turn-helix domain-containing protein [Maioricimonas sp. JB045]|uniref:helix-turn-helix domain-containing protein n=1 Tax=Maioricimonas sp. JC845 TaxID=3232138 RepID=UPI00345A36FE
MQTSQNADDVATRSELVSGIRFLRAYRECSAEIQRMIDRMVEIVADPEVDADEKEHALDTIAEAVSRFNIADLDRADREFCQTSEATVAEAELLQQEVGFSSTVRQMMAERHLTQERLAELTGVSQPAIANILSRNCRPQQRTIEKFAVALGVSPDQLWSACERTAD